ncbi:Hypothetical predicted protein [Paramuricea clavata]|uniref:Uncharacterized protein n=1 Tax=Paramuricea clavata TaxID=317549 RepID=A0A7D9HJS7_PARCT|nr:Hypothetical predicted protein [Paramuricea clavata]
MLEDETDSQGGIPAPVEVIVIVGPTNSTIAKFGDTLRWKIWPWSKCVDGKQIRAVRCYHFFAEKEYHVIVDACIKYVAPMPAKERDC